MKILAEIRIFGMVQGVFFRQSAKQMADSLNIKGFVRNEPDGESIYIEAEGERENIQKFIEWCRKGPPSARIKDLKVEFLEELKNYKNFEIK